MPNWSGLILTDRGKNLQAKVEAGSKLNFTKIKFGDGVISGSQTLEKLIDLVSPKQNVVISSVEAKDSSICEITSVLSNSGVAQGYYLKEMGIFATDPDIGEIMFAVSADTAPDYLVAGGGSVVISEAFSINLIVSNTANLAIKTHNDDSKAHAAAINKHNTDYNGHSTAMNFWQKSKVYAAGNVIFPKVHGSQYCFVCTQAGTSGTTEPTWVYTENTLVTDNTCKWTVSRIAVMRDFVFATTATALASGGTGVVGTSNTYARGDHTHTLPAYPVVPGWGTSTSALVSGGTGLIGTATTIARSDHTHTLPVYPTSLPANGGNADTVDSCHAGVGANNVLKLGADAKVPAANLPLATTTAVGAVKVGEGLKINAGVMSAEIQLNVLQCNKAYAIGDIAYSKNLPSWARLECVKAGTTAAMEPQWTNILGGVILDDGSVRWIVDDIRDGLMCGSIGLEYVLKAGRVKGNGALLQRTSYPRLFKWVQDNVAVQTTEANWNNNKHLYTLGDGSTTFRVPDLRGQWLQAAESIGLLAAGLPNIGGEIGPIVLRTSAVGGIKAIGAFTTKAYRGDSFGQQSGWMNVDYAFSASDSNAIYGGSNTVQPPSIQLVAQIKY